MTSQHGRFPPTFLHPDHDYCPPCLAIVERMLTADLERMTRKITRDIEGLTDATITHGTRGGYDAHLKKGTTCPACREANAERQRRKRAKVVDANPLHSLVLDKPNG